MKLYLSLSAALLAWSSASGAAAAPGGAPATALVEPTTEPVAAPYAASPAPTLPKKVFKKAPATKLTPAATTKAPATKLAASAAPPATATAAAPEAEPAPAPPASAQATPAPVSKPAATATPRAPWLRAAKKEAAPVATKPAMSGLRIAAMLGLVALLGAVAFYAKRRKQGTARVPSQARLRVVETTRVGTKAQAVVATVGGRRILLGVTDHSVNLLAWLDADAPATERDELFESAADDLPENAPPVASPVSDGAGGFLRLLRSAVGSSDPSDVPGAAPAERLAETTRDEVHVSRRAAEVLERVEGQAAGLMARTNRAPAGNSRRASGAARARRDAS